jgi:hypothetical protein
MSTLRDDEITTGGSEEVLDPTAQGDVDADDADDADSSDSGDSGDHADSTDDSDAADPDVGPADSAS